MSDYRCKICGHDKLAEVFVQKGLPVSTNAICPTLEAAAAFPVGDLDFQGCLNCGFTFNYAYNPALLQYTGNYENNQANSPSFIRHMAEIAAHLPLPDKDINILEVGCGQGGFLFHLAEKLGPRLTRGVGFDPAVRQPFDDGRLALISGFASAAQLPPGSRPAQAFSRHVIEHVDDPEGFARSFGQFESLVSLALETPDVGWILKNRAYYDFYYEHCSLFTPKALMVLLNQAGWPRATVGSFFQGQYLLAVGRKDDDSPSELSGGLCGEDNGEDNYAELFKGFADGRRRYLDQWSARL